MSHSNSRKQIANAVHPALQSVLVLPSLNKKKWDKRFISKNHPDVTSRNCKKESTTEIL
jgi:hypothetical protein